jgi:hypothetical protein
MRVVAGTSFTKQTLSGSSNNAKGLIAGKSLYNYSQDVAKNVRKALSLFHEYMDTDSDGNPAYPSGKTQDDLNVYILKGMYKYTHTQLAKQEKDLVLIDSDSALPASASSTVVSDADLDVLATDSVEQGWWFPGFFCFVAFGPQAPPEYRATRFMITDDLASKKKGILSRRKNREKLGNKAQELRDNACPGDNRGVSLKTSKEAAEIAINSQLVEQRGEQNTFLALKTTVDTEMETYKLLVQTLQIVKDDAVLKKETMEDIKRCRGEVAVAKNNLDVFTRSCNKRQKSNSAVADYLAKTGVGSKLEKKEIQNITSSSSSDSPQSSSDDSD